MSVGSCVITCVCAYINNGFESAFAKFDRGKDVEACFRTDFIESGFNDPGFINYF